LDAAFVESEELEIAAFGNPDAGMRVGRVDLGVSGGEFVGLGDASRKDSRLQTGRMFRSPAVVGYGLD
jgi:hypothetical protein